MSVLFPNGEALVDQLVGETPARRDARALVAAALAVETEEGLDDAIDAVVIAWRST